MERVTSREFIQHTSKHLKSVPIIVTKNGEDYYRIERVGYEKVLTPSWVKKDLPETYGCLECVKVAGQALCKKHGRM